MFVTPQITKERKKFILFTKDIRTSSRTYFGEKTNKIIKEINYPLESFLAV